MSLTAAFYENRINACSLSSFSGVAMTPMATAMNAMSALLHPSAPTGARRSGTARRMMERLIEKMRDPYRPELHYMRGPGPKWRAKHGLPPLPPR